MSWTISKDTPAVAISQRLACFSQLRHGVTVRDAEPGDRDYSFSTCADHSSVVDARRAICDRLGFSIDDLIVPAQAHGANVAVVGSPDRGRGARSPSNAAPACDALVTNTYGLLLGITVADCLPVFIVDHVNGAVGLAHSGWRGTAARIAVRTLETMADAFGSLAENCIAAIGPGIGPDGYEVDESVWCAFSEDDRRVPDAFVPTGPGHWALDLTAIVRSQIAEAGVPLAAIDVSPWRTHTDTSLFHSHRRSPGCPRIGAFLGLRAVVSPL